MGYFRFLLLTVFQLSFFKLQEHAIKLLFMGKLKVIYKKIKKPKTKNVLKLSGYCVLS